MILFALGNNCLSKRNYGLDPTDKIIKKSVGANGAVQIEMQMAFDPCWRICERNTINVFGMKTSLFTQRRHYLHELYELRPRGRRCERDDKLDSRYHG